METDFSNDIDEGMVTILDGGEPEHVGSKTQSANDGKYSSNSSNNARRKLEEYLDNRILEKMIQNDFDW